MSRQYERDMTISHREFLRLLPPALQGRGFTREADTILVSDGSQRIRIRLAAEEERKLASLSLPRTRVSLELDGFTEDSAKQFIERFDLAYRKGGG